MNFDFACWQIFVYRFIRARTNNPGNRQNRLITQSLYNIKMRITAINHTLRQTEMIAQINKHDTTMITFSMHPARKAHRLADFCCGKCCTMMGTIAMHDKPQFQQKDGILYILGCSMHQLSQSASPRRISLYKEQSLDLFLASAASSSLGL